MTRSLRSEILVLDDDSNVAVDSECFANLNSPSRKRRNIFKDIDEELEGTEDTENTGNTEDTGSEKNSKSMKDSEDEDFERVGNENDETGTQQDGNAIHVSSSVEDAFELNYQE